jgi:multidrug efflux pump subunit AcrA (membrane-fusion protein)
MSESKNSQARFAQELKSTLSDINQRQTDLVEEFDKLKNEYKKNADKEKARAEKAIQKANKDHEQFKSKLRQQLNDLFNDVRDSEIKEQIKAGDIEFSLAIIENTLQAIDILIEYDILK